MKCARCSAAMSESTTTDVSDFEHGIVIIRHVPCYKCPVCGEIFYTAVVVKKIEEIVTSAKKLSSEVSIIEFSNRAA